MNVKRKVDVQILDWKPCGGKGENEFLINFLDKNGWSLAEIPLNKAKATSISIALKIKIGKF